MIIVSLFICVQLFGQKHKIDSALVNKFHVIVGDSISTRMAKIIQTRTSKLFNDPREPRFVMVDKSSKYLFGIGGFVKTQLYYDRNGDDGMYFVVSEFPLHPHNNPSGVGFSANPSRLFFKLLGDTKLGIIEAYIEADFMGYKSALRLRQAYVAFKNFKIGKAWSIYKDSEEPSTLDLQGPVSISDRKVPLISYYFKPKDGMKLDIALEFPATNSVLVENRDDINNGVIHKIPQKIPDLPISFTYDKGNSHLFAAVNNRLMTHPNAFSKKFKLKYNFAAILSANFDLIKRDNIRNTIFMQTSYAYGMVDCIQDLSDHGYNQIYTFGKDALTIPSGIGAYLGYKVAFGKNEINTIYSYAHLFADGIDHSTIYKNGHYVAMNYIRKILKYGTIAGELLYGYRNTFNDKWGDSFRVNLMLRYDF